MTSEDLETLLEITLGSKVATDVVWESEGDPYAAAEVLKRRADTISAPYRARHHDDTGFGAARKDVARLHLVARLLDEVIYDLDEELDVELVRSA